MAGYRIAVDHQAAASLEDLIARYYRRVAVLGAAFIALETEAGIRPLIHRLKVR